MDRRASVLWKYSLVMVIGFFIVTNLSWVFRDTNPMPAGDSYAEVSRVLSTIDMGIPVTPSEVSAFLTNLSRRGRPPLYQLTTIPVILMFGRSEDAFIAVNLLFLAMLYAGVYGTVRVAAGQTAGLVAVIVVACLPPLVYLSHQYLPYNGAFAATAVTLCFLALCLRDRQVGYVWAAAGFSALALLMHPVVVYVLFVPMASTWIWGALSSSEGLTSVRPSRLGPSAFARLRDPFFLKGLLPATIVPLLAVWLWYFRFGKSLLAIFISLRTDWLASFRGTAKLAYAGVPADLRWYPVTSPHAISMPLVIATLLAAMWLLARGTTVGRFLVFWLLSAYVGLGTLQGMSWSYGAFGLPFVAVVVGAGAAAVVPQRLRRGAFIALVAISAINYSIMNWGVPRVPAAWGLRPGRYHCPRPATSPYWPIGEVVQAIVEGESAVPGTPESVFVFTPRLNDGVFGFTRSRYWPSSRIRFSNQGAPFWGREFPIRELIESDWIIVLEPIDCKRTWNPYFRATACILESPPPEFEEAHTVVGHYNLSGGGRLTLLRRVAPVTLAEIDATLANLNLNPKFVTSGAILAASLLERDGRRAEAIERLRAAAAVDGQPPATRANILSQACGLHLKDGAIEAAIEECRAAVAAAPTNVIARIRLGLALEQSGRVQEAKDELREACRLAPTRAWLREKLRQLESLPESTQVR